MVTEGSVLDGLYRLDRLIGRGGFAEVYLATELRLGRSVAIKVLRPDRAADDRFLARFEEEAKIVAALNHPHILPIYFSHHVENKPYLVMPYVASGTLGDHLARQSCLPLRQTRAYIGQMAAALDYAYDRHRIVHRDIKPQNVLLSDNGAHALVADFGIARIMSGDNSVMYTRFAAGSMPYIAPEVFRGQIRRSNDVYALGCVLFELLTGKPPYTGTTEYEYMYNHLSAPIPRVAQRGLPAAVQQVIDRALAKEPGERFSTASELVRAFDAALAVHGDGGHTATPPPYQRASPTEPTLVRETSNDLPTELQPTVPLSSTLGNAPTRTMQLDAAWNLFDQGTALRQQGRHEEALAKYKEALRLGPDLTTIWQGAATTLVTLGRPEEALDALERMLRLQPEDAEAWSSKGRILGELGRWEEALTAYERALAYRPAAADLWRHKGTALINLRRHGEALAAYDRARAIQSGELRGDLN